MKQNANSLCAVEQDYPQESRDAFIAIGSYRLRVEPYLKTAYDRFKRRQKSTKGTDIVNLLINDGLIFNGFLSDVTKQDVTRSDARIEHLISMRRRELNLHTTEDEAREMLLEAGMMMLEAQGYLTRSEIKEMAAKAGLTPAASGLASSAQSIGDKNRRKESNEG
jgi:hypothetical protein